MQLRQRDEITVVATSSADGAGKTRGPDSPTRTGLAILGAGVVAFAVVILLQLGWTGFLPTLVVLAVGAWFVVRGRDTSGPRTMLAYCVAVGVLFVGIGWAHPQRWAQPGWKLDRPGAVLLGRHNATVYFYDGGFFSARSLTSGKLLWRFHGVGPKALLQSADILVQSPGNPATAGKYSTGTGERLVTVPWPADATDAYTLTADGQLHGIVTARPTAAQTAKMPALDGDEHVVASVAAGSVAARLDAAVDPTGHHYTRLDIVDGPTAETFRVAGATGLQLRDDVLVVDSARPHVIGLLRHAPKKA